MSDPETSVTLIEMIETETRTILIQEFINGGTLNNVLACRDTHFSEKELQVMMQQLAKGLSKVYERSIIHRDLNVNNVMLHFPDI